MLYLVLPFYADLSGEFDLTQEYGDILPPRDENSIFLTVEQPVYSLDGDSSLATVQYNKTFKAILDTGNSMSYPSMSLNVYKELKAIDAIKSSQKITDTHTLGRAVNGANFTTWSLDLEIPLRFLTEVGTKIEFQKFYILHNMPDDINIGKYAMSKLEIFWDLRKDFVYVGKHKVPLRSDINK